MYVAINFNFYASPIAPPTSCPGPAAYPLRPEAAATGTGAGPGRGDGHSLHSLCGDVTLTAPGDALGTPHGLQGQ